MAGAHPVAPLPEGATPGLPGGRQGSHRRSGVLIRSRPKPPAALVSSAVSASAGDYLNYLFGSSPSAKQAKAKMPSKSGGGKRHTVEKNCKVLLQGITYPEAPKRVLGFSGRVSALGASG